MNTGPLAPVQVKAHIGEQRLEVKPRRAGSAVVLETTVSEEAELSGALCIPQSSRVTLQTVLTRRPQSQLFSMKLLARLHLGLK